MTARRASALTITLGSLLLFTFVLTAWTATLHKSPTVDEPASLVASWVQLHFHDWRADCENPPLWQDAIAVGLPRDLFPVDRNSSQWKSMLVNGDEQAPFGFAALYGARFDAESLMRSAHLRMTLLAAALGIVIAWWSWRLAGRVAAVCALAAFCFDPTVLAHAPIIKNDVMLALFAALFMAAVWLLGQRATVFRLLAVYVFLGCAIMTKFSGVIALGALAIALLARSMIPLAWPVGSRMAATFKRRLAFSFAILFGAILFAWLFTWACYDFRFLPAPDSPDQYDFNATLRSLARHQAFAASDDPFNTQPGEIETYLQTWHAPASSRLLLFANQHHLLPQTCLIGLLRTQAFAAAREAFLCGQSSVTGWWYYFPLAFIFKTPISTLIALALASIVLLPRLRRINATAAWPLCAAAIFPAIYLLTAMQSHVNVGIRHLLPIYPFLFIFLGVASAAAWNTARHPGFLVVALLAAGLIAETLAAYPNFISFFNIACGGERGGIRLLSDSNLDWGQDLPALADWQARHRDRSLRLLYWGSADPRYYGISYVNLPDSTAAADLPSPAPGTPAYAIGASILTNRFEQQARHDLLGPLLRKEPIAVLNGSIYIYDAP